jgi:hypothetical protein
VRQDSARATLIETKNRKAPAGKLIFQDSRDEEARNNEEHVNADKAAAKTRNTCMIENDWDDGDSSQPVDVRAIGRHSLHVAC